MFDNNYNPGRPAPQFGGAMHPGQMPMQSPPFMPQMQPPQGQFPPNPGIVPPQMPHPQMPFAGGQFGGGFQRPGLFGGQWAQRFQGMQGSPSQQGFGGQFMQNFPQFGQMAR